MKGAQREEEEDGADPAVELSPTISGSLEPGKPSSSLAVVAIGVDLSRSTNLIEAKPDGREGGGGML